MPDNYYSNIPKGYCYLWTQKKEIFEIYKAFEEYLDELIELSRYPDIYWDDYRIFKRALERIFQLIVDGIIEISTKYLYGKKTRDIKNFKIVSQFDHWIRPQSIVSSFSGYGQYVHRRNQMVHRDPFNNEKDELENECTRLLDTTKNFINQLKYLFPCPNCGEMLDFYPTEETNFEEYYIQTEYENKYSVDRNIPLNLMPATNGIFIHIRCKKSFTLNRKSPIILFPEPELIRDTAYKFLNGNEEFKPDKKKALEIFDLAANLGDNLSLVWLSICYLNGTIFAL